MHRNCSKLRLFGNGGAMSETHSPRTNGDESELARIAFATHPIGGAASRRHRLTDRLPDVCVVHGRPTQRRVRLNVPSRPTIPYDHQSDLKRLVRIGDSRLSRWAERTARTHFVETQWPMCPECAGRFSRSKRLVGAYALAGVAALLVFLGGYLALGGSRGSASRSSGASPCSGTRRSTSSIPSPSPTPTRHSTELAFTS